MATAEPALRPAPGDDASARAAALEDAWGRGERPDLAAHWAAVGPDAPLDLLAALVKADLRGRFARGERPEVAEYLARFPALGGLHDPMVSLTYEEFCLLEQRGARPDPDEFCARYDRWRDSLQSQLHYHKMLSRAVTPAGTVDFPPVGARFGPFRLEQVLGSGGAARVYLAADEGLNDCPRALKISADRGDEPAIQSRLDHPRIVQVLSVVRTEGSDLRGMCMPYRPGRPLDKVLDGLFRGDAPGPPATAAALRQAAASGPEPPPALGDAPGWRGFRDDGPFDEGVAWVGAELARALQFAHGQGVLHRDVKPGNVLLTVKDGPQLLDFNLAHAPLGADDALDSLRGGTLPYMAPEQLLAFLQPEQWRDVGAAADIYGLGLVLREMLTGRRPEAPGHDVPPDQVAIELLHRRTEPDRPVAADPAVPAELGRIIRRCLAPDPDRRYASAAELAEALEGYVARRRSLRARLIARARRHPRILAAAAVVLLLALGSAALAHRIVATIARDHVRSASRRMILNDWTGAREELRRALDLDHDNPQAHRDLARAAFRLGQFAECAEHGEAALRLLGDDAGPREQAELHQLVGRALHNLNRFEAAHDHFQRGSELVEGIVPRDEEAVALSYVERSRSLARLAQQALDRGTAEGRGIAEVKFQEAADLLDTAARHDARVTRGFGFRMAQYDAIRGRGDVASRKDRYAESVRLYERAQRLLDEARALAPNAPGLDDQARAIRLRLEIDSGRLDEQGRDAGPSPAGAGGE